MTKSEEIDPDSEPDRKKQVERAEKQIIEQSKRIEYYLTDYSVELLALKMGKGDFEIPGYQREDTWEDERKSRFIESLLMGLPIPFLFFWEQPDGKLEVVRLPKTQNDSAICGQQASDRGAYRTD